MGKSRIVLILCMSIVAIAFRSNAQKDQNRYIIHFPDKSDSQFSISQPIEFLSQKAIDRREKHDIPITEEDFPVSQKYIDSLSVYGIKTYAISRWFNCSWAQTTQEKIDVIKNKSFVTKVEYVAPGAKFFDKPEKFNGEYVPKEPGSITRTSESQLSQLDANVMHNAGYTGKGIWIAILDGGFKGVDSSAVFNHIYENHKIRDKKDFTTGGDNIFQYDDHGTNVFSCIGSKYRNTLIGTAYDADFSLYVTEEPNPKDEYRIEEYNWALAAERSDSSGVDIISSSLGYNTFEDPSMNYRINDLDGKTAIITRAANIAFSKGMLVVVSAGNSGNEVSWDRKINFPADGDNVLTVGAVDEKNKVAGFSSRGPTTDGRIKPDLLAQGSRTAVLHGTGNIGFNNGTSFAAPLIAGFAAAVWQYNPALTNYELLQLLKSTGDSFNSPDNERGYGLPSFSRVTGKVLAVDKVLLDKIKVFPNPFPNNKIQVRIPDDFNSKTIEFLIYNSKGKLVGKKKVNQPNPNALVDVNIRSKTKGIYFLSINSEKFTKRVKLIKY